MAKILRRNQPRAGGDGPNQPGIKFGGASQLKEKRLGEMRGGTQGMRTVAANRRRNSLASQGITGSTHQGRIQQNAGWKPLAGLAARLGRDTAPRTMDQFQPKTTNLDSRVRGLQASTRGINQPPFAAQKPNPSSQINDALTQAHLGNITGQSSVGVSNLGSLVRGRLGESLAAGPGRDDAIATAARAEFERDAEKARQAKREELSRLGLLRSGGDTADALGELEGQILLGGQRISADRDVRLGRDIERASDFARYETDLGVTNREARMRELADAGRFAEARAGEALEARGLDIEESKAGLESQRLEQQDRQFAESLGLDYDRLSQEDRQFLLAKQDAKREFEATHGLDVFKANQAGDIARRGLGQEDVRLAQSGRALDETLRRGEIETQIAAAANRRAEKAQAEDIRRGGVETSLAQAANLRAEKAQTSKLHLDRLKFDQAKHEFAASMGLDYEKLSQQDRQFVDTLAQEAETERARLGQQERQFSQTQELERRRVDEAVRRGEVETQIASAANKRAAEQQRMDWERSGQRLDQEGAQFAATQKLERERLAQQGSQFAQSIGLDYDRLSQEDRQFIDRQAQQQGQFDVTSGQQERALAEDLRQGEVQTQLAAAANRRAETQQAMDWERSGQRLDQEGAQFGRRMTLEESRLAQQDRQFAEDLAQRGENLELERARLGQQEEQFSRSMDLDELRRQDQVDQALVEQGLAERLGSQQEASMIADRQIASAANRRAELQQERDWERGKQELDMRGAQFGARLQLDKDLRQDQLTQERLQREAQASQFAQSLGLDRDKLSQQDRQFVDSLALDQQRRDDQVNQERLRRDTEIALATGRTPTGTTAEGETYGGHQTLAARTADEQQRIDRERLGLQSDQIEQEKFCRILAAGDPELYKGEDPDKWRRLANVLAEDIDPRYRRALDPSYQIPTAPAQIDELRPLPEGASEAERLRRQRLMELERYKNYDPNPYSPNASTNVYTSNPWS